MKLRLHACPGAERAVAACDKPEPSARRSRETRSGYHAARTAATAGTARTDASGCGGRWTTPIELDSPGERERALAKVAWDALELDPELAREAMDRLAPDSDGADPPDPAPRDAHGGGKSGRGARMGRLARHGERTRRGFGHIALVISDSDPERAANLLSESGIAGPRLRCGGRCRCSAAGPRNRRRTRRHGWRCFRRENPARRESGRWFPDGSRAIAARRCHGWPRFRIRRCGGKRRRPWPRRCFASRRRSATMRSTSGTPELREEIESAMGRAETARRRLHADE